MVFSSITFLYYFLPLFLLVYYVTPKRGKNLVLFLGSLIFYAWGEPKYAGLMLISILVGYVTGLWIEKGYKKIGLWLGITVSFLFLFFFKYSNFFIKNINLCFRQDIPLLKIALPIGISFYTFQIVSYIIDVYYGRVKAQRNLLHLSTYISMFPQLIAGPIVRYSDMYLQLEDRKLSADRIADGIRRFIIGLSKKVIIANQLGELCHTFKASDEKSVLFYWLYGVALILHYYFDFSGYSDMAIGLGGLCGFHFPENFNYPYVSKSITEFWRRWHISLGTWFRDYVYIPLGGNRKGKYKTVCNIFVVWMLTGFWHGADWNFILWGLYFAILLILEKFILGDKLEKSKKLKWIGHIYVWILLIISFVIFDSTDLKEISTSLKGMFSFGKMELLSEESVYYFKSYFYLLTMGILGATEFPKKCYFYIKEKVLKNSVGAVIEALVTLFLLLLVTAYLIDGSFNPFLYFRF